MAEGRYGRLMLQILTGLVGVLTVVLGTVQLVFGVRSPVYGAAGIPQIPILDSNLRFFGGLALGLGLVLLWTVPDIERKAQLFRAAWGAAFLGGLGRLASAATVGTPSRMLVAFTVLEVIGAPLLVLWQARLPRHREGAKTVTRLP